MRSKTYMSKINLQSGILTGRSVPGRQVGFTFYTKAARRQIRFEPAENRAMDTKPG